MNRRLVQHQDSRRALPWTYRLVIQVVRPVLMGLTRRDWKGVEQLPAGGGFVACVNHVSYLDPLTFAHFLIDNDRPPFFLAKEGLFRAPGLGSVVRSAGQIPVYRNSMQAADAFTAAVQAVHDGKCVAILPEGTLTRDPGLWPMSGKTGAARVALATGCPVIPIAQWGAQDILAPYGKVPHLLGRHTVHLLAGPPVDLVDLQGPRVDGEVLHEATERIMAAITALLEQLRGEHAPSERFDSRVRGVPVTGDPRRARRRRLRGSGRGNRSRR